MTERNETSWMDPRTKTGDQGKGQTNTMKASPGLRFNDSRMSLRFNDSLPFYPMPTLNDMLFF